MQSARALGSLTFESLTAVSHAALLLEGGGHAEQRAQAEALLRQAQTLAEACGMSALVAACDPLVAHHGLHRSGGKVIHRGRETLATLRAATTFVLVLALRGGRARRSLRRRAASPS